MTTSRRETVASFLAVDSSLSAVIFCIFLLIEKAGDEKCSAWVASVEEDVFARVLTKDAGCSRLKKWLRIIETLSFDGRSREAEGRRNVPIVLLHYYEKVGLQEVRIRQAVYTMFRRPGRDRAEEAMIAFIYEEFMVI